VCVLSYVLLLVLFIKGERRLSKRITVVKKHSINASLIIAFRNEEQNLNLIIDDIINQSYKFNEIIFVNDHSTDKGCHIIEQSIKNIPEFKLIDLPAEYYGKKAALFYGAKQANGDVLLFTDADCRLKPLWAETMLKKMEESKSKLIAGPVDMIQGEGFFHALQNLEFLSLTGSTAGGFGAGIAFMCNGANLAVNKTVYFDCVNKNGDKFASGDDVFLLHSIKKKHAVSFCYNKEAIVKTKPQENLNKFILQRIRWAGKSVGYRDKISLLISALLLIVNFLLLFLIILSIIDYRHWTIFAIVFIIKLLTDIIFMNRVLLFYEKTYLLKYILPLQIVYPIYVIITGVSGLFFKPVWKGRKIS
jgi:poly-beta-1,6-N-acetyl-D-glucosamine synthase